MNPAAAFAFDVIACVLLGFALIGSLTLAPRRPLFLTLFSIAFVVVMAIAALSCSTTPSKPAVAKSPCVVTLEAFCKKGSACGYFDERSCMARGASECDTVQGITPTEAEVCAAALQKTTCSELVPIECMSIAEPAAPQPNTREL
jgi:hypothetical protein